MESEAGRRAEEHLHSEAVDALLADVDKLGSEVRIVDPTTGGAKGSKPVQLACLPARAMQQLGLVYGMGAAKYEAHNFRKGYKWSLSVNAMLRHFFQWLDEGQPDADEESGVSHMAHIAWHALTLLQFEHDHPELDDRYKPEAR